MSNWTNEQLEKHVMHPLIVIATFVYEFLSIHPYQDGNDRLSRLLTTLWLMQQGYQFIQYVSFENIIEEQKEVYYGVLMEDQQKRYREEERIDGLMLFFLGCLVDLIQRLGAKYETYTRLKLALNSRQQWVLAFIRGQQTTQVGAIEKALNQYARNTLKKDLQYLVKEGLILKTDAGRGAYYHAKEQ